MSKLNLSEAAARILEGEDAQSILNKSRSAGRESFGVGNPKAVNKANAPQTGEVQLGTAGHTMDDSNYDGTKGMGAQATLPTGRGVAGAKFGDNPSKGSGTSDYASEPNSKQGRSDLAKSPQTEIEPSDDARRDGKKGGVSSKKTMSANPKAPQITVPESSEPDDEWEEDEELEEATIEEVMEDLENMEDEIFMEKYGMCKSDAAEKMSSDDEDEEEDEEDEDKEEEAKAKRKEKMKEDVDAMLSGENLSEEFKFKAATIFEAAVESRVEEIASELEEKYTQEFEESLELVKEDFADKLDSYLDYVVENWMADNELAIEKGLRSEIVEDFIGALKNVFVEHYIDIPEERVDIVEELVNKVDELEDQVNEQILKNIDLKKSLAEQQKIEIIHSVCEGLTLSQAEKVKSLAKNVEFVSEEDFEEKVSTIKESYFPNGVVSASSESLNESVELDEDYTTKVVDPLIEQYVSKISRLTKF